MQSKCPVCGIKRSGFVKEQEAKVLLSNLGIKTPLSEIVKCFVLSVKINEIVNKLVFNTIWLIAKQKI